MNPDFRKIYVIEKAVSSDIARSFLKAAACKNIPVDVIPDESYLPDNIEQKQNLLLTVKKGGFVNLCPCSPNMVCCGYHNINLVEGCPYICNYCALDIYLKSKAIRIFTNLSDFEAEFDAYCRSRKEIRIGTGELTDSLALEDFYSYALYLSDLALRYPSVIFELKTKSNQIQNLVDTKPQKNLLVSFSLNTQSRIKEEESFSASYDERITALHTLSEKGYRVGIHFDPIYHYDGWQTEYARAVKDIFSGLNPKTIGWVSLGIIRFAPDLKEVLQKRKSAITGMELFPNHHDRKYRLFYPLRLEIYKIMQRYLKPFTENVYICMDSPDSWLDSGFDPVHSNLQIYRRFFSA